MKRYWTQLSAKYDGLQKRERVLVMAAVLMLAAAVLNALLFEPLAAQRKVLRTQMASDAAQVQKMQQQMRDMVRAGSVDPDAGNKQRLAGMQEKLRTVDARLDGLQHALVSPDKMPALLEGLLRQHGGLKLVALNTLPPAGLPVAGEAASDLPVFRHGVEMTLEGRYLDLLNYLAALEKLPWHLSWGKLALKAGDAGVSTLTVTVYTLSMDKTWLSL